LALWTVVKAAVSLVSASFAAVIGLLYAHQPEAALLAGAGVLVFLAALPWVNLQRPSRGLGLAGIMFSFGLFLVASRPFTKANEYPLDCVRRRIWCEVENLLFLLGGPPLASLPFAVLGIGLLAFSLRAVWRLRKHP
jgi:hypothetical protein